MPVDGNANEIEESHSVSRREILKWKMKVIEHDSPHGDHEEEIGDREEECPQESKARIARTIPARAKGIEAPGVTLSFPLRREEVPPGRAQAGSLGDRPRFGYDFSKPLPSRQTMQPLSTGIRKP